MEETICEMCEDHIYMVGVEDDQAIWSHLGQTVCDDPVPAF